MELTATFLLLLQQFRPVFTAPSFAIFCDVLTGWILSVRHRFVTEFIFSSGSVGKGHWSRYHRFFSQAAWLRDQLCHAVARFLVRLLVPTGDIILAGDDTLCRKRGLTLYGAGMHHDPLISSRAMKLVSWGHDWVVLCLILPLPSWAPTKVFALPIGFRLYKNRQGLTKGKKKPKEQLTAAAKRARAKADPNHRTRPQLLVELIIQFAQWFPDRHIVLTGDSAYGGKSVLQKLPVNVDLISRVHPKGALYAPPPTRQLGQKGAGRKKGARLPNMAAWAKDTSKPWRRLKFDQFGLHAVLQVKTQQALYYKAGKGRLLTIVLVHDTQGQRPDQMFYATCLDWTTRRILATYAHRWAIEVTFENSKQHLGLEDPANRKPKAVERTAPMGLLLYSLIVGWFHSTGHRHVRFPERPWYSRKREPSFADMLGTLRRLTWEEKIQQLLAPDTPHKNEVANLIDRATRPG
jgi:hypothetical protein